MKPDEILEDDLGLIPDTYLVCANSLKRNSIENNVGVFGLLDMRAVYKLLRAKYPQCLQTVLAAEDEVRTSLLSILIRTAMLICLVDCDHVDLRALEAASERSVGVKQNRCDQQ
ncbi:hypothetical protein GQX74_001154 [Glossina fuscipes]|nr:hypothetical protein GQX74_001154 [Glossina fuscipes]